MNAHEFATALRGLVAAGGGASGLAEAARSLADLILQAPDQPFEVVLAAWTKALKPQIHAAKKKAASVQKQALAQQRADERERKVREKQAATEAKKAEQQRKANARKAAQEQKRLEREQKAAQRMAAQGQKRLEREQKAAEKKAQAQRRAQEREAAAAARSQPASAADVETAYQQYCWIRDSMATLSIAEIRLRFESIAKRGKPVLAALAARLGYPFKGSAKMIAEQLLETLEGFKVNQISTQSILGQ